jgi:hypothetical protein
MLRSLGSQCKKLSLNSVAHAYHIRMLFVINHLKMAGR